MKNEIREKKGITLIALVITIIVLLILAGVTIATLTGDNGLLTKAGNAKVTNENGKIDEQIRLAYNEWKLRNETGETIKLKKVIEDVLKQSYNEDDFTVTEEANGKTIYVNYKDTQFTVLDDGKIQPGKIVYLNIEGGTINIYNDGYVQGTNAKNPHTGKYVIAGESNENTVNIIGEGKYDITIKDLKIDVSSVDYSTVTAAFDANKQFTQNGCDVNITLEGDNKLTSRVQHAGLQFIRCKS